MPDDHALAPVRKLEPAGLVAAVNRHTDARLRLLGAAPGGQVGAAYVAWPDGREGVLTLGPGQSVESLRRTAHVLQLAHSRGIPVPRYDLVAELPDGVAIVQGRLPGRVPDRVDNALVDAMVAMNERLAGLLTDEPLLEPPNLYLSESGPGFCVHESLRRYSDRSRQLLDRIHEIGRLPAARMTGADLVHLDFHPGNILTDAAGSITGIVDWDGIGRGDRRFALVTLCFDLSAPDRDRRLAETFDAAVRDRIEPETRRAYAAHMGLRMVDWAIRHFEPADVEHWLDVAEAQLRPDGGR